MLELGLDAGDVAPGDRLRGSVVVLRGGLQVIRVGLLFRERSPIGERTVDQLLAPGFEGARELETGARLPFELTVPADGLPTLDTKKCGLFWEVVAKTDRVGSPQTASRRVVVRTR